MSRENTKIPNKMQTLLPQKKKTAAVLPLLLSSHPRRRSPEGGLDVVEELAERLLRRERAGHGVVTVVHRCVVLVQQEQQADLIGEGGVSGGGGATRVRTNRGKWGYLHVSFSALIYILFIFSLSRGRNREKLASTGRDETRTGLHVWRHHRKE